MHIKAFKMQVVICINEACHYKCIIHVNTLQLFNRIETAIEIRNVNALDIKTLTSKCFRFTAEIKRILALSSKLRSSRNRALP